ncbi:MAG: GNAT family N-acetyltransferase [Actinobacteria bacterium]|uniref:Unannotated protein n=1 Tax=freshwater metagenome TaxID=449393 RepID=A0A6J6P8Y7_9ZZZZ|nr:GNAT family N-acetyltransferase [Actinomycetota bacterium]
MAFEIRLATADDEAGLAELDLATWSSLSSPAPKPSPDAGWTFFDERTKPEQIHVAVSDQKIVGYVKLSREIDLPSTQHVRSIHGLAVYAHFRGFGIAKALMRVAEAQARAEGATKLTLRVLGHNEPARGLYESLGYETEGVLRDLFKLDDSYIDDIVMALDLTAAVS